MEEGQIVNCGGLDCSVCHWLSTINNFSLWLTTLSFAVATIFLVLGGFYYLTANGEDEKMVKAKRWIKNSLWGFALTLFSFLVVLGTFSLVGSENKDSRLKIKCEIPLVADEKPAEDNYFSSDGAYLDEDLTGQIAYSNNVNSLVSGDNRIIKLKTEELSIDNLIEDLTNLPTEREIKFVLGDRSLSDQEIVQYKNLDLGFDAEKLGNYTVKKDSDPLVGDVIMDKEGKIKEILSLNTTDVDDFYLIKNGEDIAEITGKVVNEADRNQLAKTVNVLKTMGTVASIEQKNLYAYISGDPIGEIDQCLESGGELNEFKNKCLAEKETFSGRNLNCSAVYNPIYECNCPTGTYLSGERCVSSSKDAFATETNENQNDNYTDQANDNSSESGDGGEKISKTYCRDVFLEEKKCPSSRCEGDRMMLYPSAVKDECVDTPNGPSIKRNLCIGAMSGNTTENQSCKESLNAKSDEEKRKEAEEAYNKNKQSPNWYEDLLNKEYQKGGDVSNDGSSTGNGGTDNTGKDGDNKTGNNDNPDPGPLPPDKGSGNFNPAPSFKELKECIGLKGDQIPYNGILVVLLNPADPLNRKHVENISRMYYLARDGKLIGKNGGLATETGGQEYGARTYDKSTTGSPNGPSMWGRGWKIFKGPTKYNKNGWTDHCSYGSHDGYKTGVSERALDEANLKGGKVTSVSRCGQHIRNKYSSAGCATMGDNTRCGFINTSKTYMTKTNGTIMQINLVGEINPSNGKFSSPDCGKIDYCGAKRIFEASGAKKFKNDPNDGYDGGDSRRVEC